jgi:hypothetical protein
MVSSVAAAADAEASRAQAAARAKLVRNRNFFMVRTIHCQMGQE